MERVRRRWWTWTVSIIATLVIIAAGISGVFQFAVMALPDYRDDLSVWITEIAGRPVQIGGVNLVWRGFNPRLDLSDITLYDETGNEEMLTAERLSLGFSLLRLARGEALPKRVVLSGLTIDAHVDREGRITLAGFEQDRERTPTDLRQWLSRLERFSSLRLERCSVNLEVLRRDYPEQLRVVITQFDLGLKANGMEAEAELLLPAAYGESLSFEASIDGPVAAPEQWRGEFSAQASGLLPQPWLRGALAPGTRVSLQDGAAELTGSFASGRLSQLKVDFDSGAVQAARAGASVDAASVQVRLLAVRENQSWNLHIKRFALDGDDQLTAQLDYLPLPQDGFELNAEGATLQLHRLAPWLQFLREPSPALARAAQLSGEITHLGLRLQRGHDALRYSLQAQLNGFALGSDGASPGFSGLSGELAASENGGRFLLKGAPPQLLLPRTFETPLVFDALSGPLQWRRLAQGWQVGMTGVDWKLADSSGHAQFELTLPGDTAHSPELDLTANFSAADVNALKPYMPKTWGVNLRNWLSRALETGRVPRAQLAIKGPLRDFPFDTKSSGEWKLDIDAADIRLAYAPSWPAAENVQALLRFRGNGLTIESTSAQLGGNRIEQVTARFADFRDRLLTIDGVVAGETAAFYNFLRNSPLRKTLSGLVDNTRAAGPARVALHLDIPLEKSADATATGTVALDGVQLYYGELREPVSDIRGEIAFNHEGVSAQKLDARFEDLTLAARIDPRAQTNGVIGAEFVFTPKADGSGVSGYIPELVRARLSGESLWRAELPLAAENSELVLTSNLHGTALDLPVPLAKAAGEALPLRIAVGSASDQALHVRVAYGSLLAADIALADAGDSDASAATAPAWSPRGINLQLGADSAPPATTGLFLAGATAELDLAAWSAALGATLKSSEQPGGFTLRGAEVQAQRLLFGDHFLREMHVVYTPVADGWNAQLSGAGGEGELLWRGAQTNSRLAIKLARLDLQRAPVDDFGDAPAPEKESTGPVFDPNDWPQAQFNCTQCVVDGADLGHVRFNTARIAGGQRLDNFSAQGGALQASASGEWLRSAGMSSARIKFDLSTAEFSSLLKSLGYAENLSAKNSRLDGDLAWTPAANGIDWEQARGPINLRFENGTLKAVDPGAGRVLGLLNFYALPRRLTLDFRDVVKSGMAYDKITGSFNLADGNARTEDLKIQTTALRMEMQGRVGLAARDYDQRISVVPDVSSGITLGAALLGGPALAAIAFIAQEVLDKPISQATQLSYQVTGSWDDPQIKRVEKNEAGENAAKPKKRARVRP